MPPREARRAFPKRLAAIRLTQAIALAAVLGTAAAALEPGRSRGENPSAAFHEQLRARLERALESWCRWLSGYLRPVPGTDLYTMTPRLNTGPPYRDVAGNQFAAAAAAYWLARAEPEPQVVRPLEGLIKLTLLSHVAIRGVDRSDVPLWGAGHSPADNWHADLFAATSGMLMLPGLASRQREQLLKILAWEADKQVEYGISVKSRTKPGRWPEHSVGESNAWSTALLQAARLALPDSPRQAAWRSTAIDYSLNSICMPEDLSSDRIIGGRALRERVKGANFEPGGIQEHHGFYHPGYMAWPLAYQAFAELMDNWMAAPARDPDVYLYHWKQAFDRLKQSTFANGRFIHCAGDDWNAYGYGNDHILPIGIFAAVRFGDPDAARLVDQWLALMEQAQSLTGGPVQGARLGRLQRRYANDFAWYEAISGASLAHALYVLARADPAKMPSPSSEEEYNARNTGTYHEPNARLVWHRDKRRWASFCWRSAFGEWQAIVQPIRLPHLLKFNHNSIGLLEAAEAGSRNKLQWFKIGTLARGGFWSLGTVDRLSKKGGKDAFLVRQHQALVALPEGPCLLVDCCQALDHVSLARSGGLGLRLAADIFNRGQVRIQIDGHEKTFGPSPNRDGWHDLQTRSLLIENQLRIEAIAGEGTFQLLQRRGRQPDGESPYPYDPCAVEESLLSHELYFGPPSCARSERLKPGEWFRGMILRIDCSSPTTSWACSATASGGPASWIIKLPDIRRVVLVNFADVQQSADDGRGRTRVPPRSVIATSLP